MQINSNYCCSELKATLSETVQSYGIMCNEAVEKLKESATKGEESVSRFCDWEARKVIAAMRRANASILKHNGKPGH